MQIMPGSWTNPAALNQQALGDSKHSAAAKNNSIVTEPVNPLEESGKTGDRDANERYDGPQHSGTATQGQAAATASESESMLSLRQAMVKMRQRSICSGDLEQNAEAESRNDAELSFSASLRLGNSA